MTVRAMGMILGVAGTLCRIFSSLPAKDEGDHREDRVAIPNPP